MWGWSLPIQNTLRMMMYSGGQSTSLGVEFLPKPIVFFKSGEESGTIVLDRFFALEIIEFHLFLHRFG
jgi:hypothetical protein